MKNRNSEMRKGMKSMTDASIPAEIPFNLLKLNEISRNPIKGKRGTSQIYSSIG
jgi:hypothetical protein